VKPIIFSGTLSIQGLGQAEYNYLLINPVALVEKPGVDQRRKLIPTPQEMSPILLAAGKDRPLLLALFHTMGRIDEVLRLKWENINWERHEIRLWTRKRRGGAWQFHWLPMNAELEGVFRNLWQNGPRTNTSLSTREPGTVIPIALS